ncbi:mpv17-like protein [Halyomorpha halys]|uniref:mpv17-like protein n=1 Tax=Halyomorpha halys TaxID=286706 RepID=UPI0006D520FE
MAVIKLVKTLFKRHPLLANSVTFGTMWGFSDFSQQIITKRFLDCKQPLEPINKGTIVRCTIVGSCVTSNILFFWYKWMEKRFTGSSYKILVKKILLDQFVLTPPLLSAFFISMSILESREDITAEWKEKIVPTMQKAWFFWFPAQMINFLFIPSVMRITYISCCSFIWTNILCFVKRTNSADIKCITEQKEEQLTL